MKTLKNFSVMLVACATMFLASCKDDNDSVSPTVDQSAVSIQEGTTGTVVVSGGEAPYTVASSATGVATANISGNTVTITGVAPGTATITITGNDNGKTNVAITVTKDTNPNNDGTGETFLFGPDFTQIGDGKKDFSITKSHTLKKGVYTLVGWILVKEGATLTIEPGTIIKGTNKSYDGTEAANGSSLIIERGAKIMAEGTKDAPIVFTSAKPKGQRMAADWGGVIICGKAKNNQGEMTVEGGVNAKHGGSDDDDNSGVMKYCRLEFGGYPYSTDNEINGLTLGSVGRGTKLEYIQVSYAGDDSFEWFGGSVNCNHLVAYHGWDDDFDTDNGFSGKMQFLLGVRHPRIADQSNSNGFESDNNQDGTLIEPYTSCVFSNVTFIGPRGQDDNFLNDKSYITGLGFGENSGIRTGIFQAAMQIRRSSKLSCFNSVATGYPVGLLLDKGKGNTQGFATDGSLKLKNIYFAGMGILGADDDSKTDGSWKGEFSISYFNQESLNNKNFTDISALMLKQPKSITSSGAIATDANWGPVAGSPLLTGANFDDAMLSSGFEKVTYVGAFASDTDNWIESWTNFDPQNTDY